MSEFDELRALVREVIRDVLPHGLPTHGLPVTETVDLSTDEDLAAFVARLLELDPGEREDLQTGRKRFGLARGNDGTAVTASGNGISAALDAAALRIPPAPAQASRPRRPDPGPMARLPEAPRSGGWRAGRSPRRWSSRRRRPASGSCSAGAPCSPRWPGTGPGPAASRS